MAEASYETILVDRPRAAVARVTLNRPEAANAQDMKMLYELTAAFDAAVADPEVKVIVLAAAGKHFSSGHDLRDRSKITDYHQVTVTGGFEQAGEAGHMAVEEEIYLGFCNRWRNLPKPTIAAVQGKVIAGGCMLVWPMDLVVCADDATFSDPVVAFGVNGVEYFAHAYELGPRKAKEMLFTGEALSAEECRQLGMVNHVVAREELEGFTLDLAERISARPAFGLKLAKMSVNQSVDAMGFRQALDAAFSLQHLGHANNQIVHKMLVDPAGAEIIRSMGRKS
jgi:enoyl-CoA hydratase